MKRLGLRLKFALVIVVLLALIFGAVAAILIKQNSHSLRDDLNTKAKLFATLATTPIGNVFLTYQESGQIKITQQIQAFTDLNHEIANVAVVDTSGQVVFNQHPEQTIQIDAATASSFTAINQSNPNGIIKRIITPLIEDNGSHRYNLVYDVSSASVETAIRQTETSILWFVMLGLIASVGLTYLVTSRLFVNPLQQVSRQALSISSGHLDQAVQVKSRDEVGDLAKAVNTMAESLKADIAKLQEVDRLKSEFMMITSHNLRTPLTIINGYMESLRGFKVNQELRKILDTMAVSGKQLAAFAEDMLTISKVESGENVLHKQPTLMVELLGDIAKDFTILANNKGVNFSSDLAIGETQADISPPHLRSALWNLLDNALKFTKAGGHIKLEAKLADQSMQIAIADTGIGIAKEEMSKLFTKFHRGTSTLEYEYEGTGIGLYATKLVIERLGGTIQATSALGQGSTFSVTLPIIQRPAHH